jgi:hypothetical protein
MPEPAPSAAAAPGDPDSDVDVWWRTLHGASSPGAGIPPGVDGVVDLRPVEAPPMTVRSPSPGPDDTGPALIAALVRSRMEPDPDQAEPPGLSLTDLGFPPRPEGEFTGPAPEPELDPIGRLHAPPGAVATGFERPAGPRWPQPGDWAPGDWAPYDRAPDDRAPDDRAPDDRAPDDRAPDDRTQLLDGAAAAAGSFTAALPVSRPAASRASQRRMPASHGSWTEAVGAALTSLPRTVVAGLAAVLAFGLIAGLGYVVVRRTTSPEPVAGSPSGTRSNGAGSTVAAAAVVPVSTITATASTSQTRAGSITYVAANTLDGKPETAWNSDGDGTGATLTYTFAGQVHLRTITMLDGYQKISKSAGDLWSANARVKQVSVTSDAGNWTWDLNDTKAAQTFTQDLGTTSSVKLKIVSLYPGAKYRDTAISEVSFTAG